MDCLWREVVALVPWPCSGVTYELVAMINVKCPSFMPTQVVSTTLVHVHVCYVLSREQFWLNKVSYFLEVIWTWECALNWFTLEPLHECLLNICNLSILGQHILNMYFLVIPMCIWFLIDLKICMTLTQHILNKYHWNFFGWTCVSRCKSMWKVCNLVVAPLPQIAKLP